MSRSVLIELMLLSAHDFPPQILLDDKKFKKIVDNLLGNAINYSPEGASVWLRVEQDGERARAVPRRYQRRRTHDLASVRSVHVVSTVRDGVHSPARNIRSASATRGW